MTGLRLSVNRENIMKHEFIIFGENQSQAFALVIRGLLSKSKLHVVSGDVPSWIKGAPFLKNYLESHLVLHSEASGKHNFWLKFNDMAIQIVEKYYEEILSKSNSFERAYNHAYRTDKFSAYLKDALVYHCFKILNDLFLITCVPKGMRDRKICLVDTPFNRFIVRHYQENENNDIGCCWASGVPNVFLTFCYGAFFLKSLLQRGITFGANKKEYRVAKEVTLGFHRNPLRDDLIVDNKVFAKNDLLLIEFSRENTIWRNEFKKAQEYGYDTVSVPDLKVNLNKDGLSFFYLYLWLFLYWLFGMIFSPAREIYYYLFLFHKHSFPVAVLMQSYSFPLFILSCDVKHVEKTIIFNRYGTKVCLLYWSDVVANSPMFFAYNAHNISFNWGDIYRDHHAQYRKVEESINIGCIYKHSFSESLRRKNEIMTMLPSQFDPKNKTVLFCDTSFCLFMEYSEDFFIDFIKVMRNFCKRYPNVNVIYKAKNCEETVLNSLIDLKDEYLSVWKDLLSFDNFTNLDIGKWTFEVAASLADVIVSMAMNTTSTVALICGKDALYYDITGNRAHPIARDFFNSLVFDNQETLFRQIENILDKRFSCGDVLNKNYIQQFDPYDDDKAIERFREHVYELTQPKEYK